MQQILPIPVDIPAQQTTNTGASSATGIEGLFAAHLNTASEQQPVQNPTSRKGDHTAAESTSQDAADSVPPKIEGELPLSNNGEPSLKTEELTLLANGVDFTLPVAALPQARIAQDGSVLLAATSQPFDNKQAITRLLNTITDSPQQNKGQGLFQVSSITADLPEQAAVRSLTSGPDNNQPTGTRGGLEQLFQNQSIKNASTMSPDTPVTNQQAPVGPNSFIAALETESKTTSQQTAQVLETPPLQPQQARTATSNSQATVTIENWSATFKPDNNTQTRSTALPPDQQVEGKANNIPLTRVLANDKGQVITVTQVDAGEQYQARTFSASPLPTTDTSGQRQDVNSNYMHSNLPNGSLKADQANGQSQQQTGSGDPQQQGDKPMPADPLFARDPLSDREPTPLIFSLDQASAPMVKTGVQVQATGPLFRMPSGLQVPDGAPMDQVINQLTTGRKLETGSVTMKLHPQELGELRLEIKVEQDNIKAHITTQNPQAQEMLDRHLPRLREALEQQGLRLDQVAFTVTDKNEDSQLFQNNPGQQQLNLPKTNQRQDPVSNLAMEEEPEDYPEQHQSLNVLA